MPNATSPDTRIDSGRFSLLLLAGVGVAVAVILALAGYSLWQGRDTLQREAEREAESMARLLDHNIHSAIHEADLALQVSAQEYRHSLGTRYSEAGVRDYSLYLETLRQRLPHILSLRGTDASGLLRYGEGINPSQPVNIADRKRFRAAMDAVDGRLVIGAPIIARMSQQWVLPLTRRIEDAQGRFAGIVLANIPVSHFSKLFASIKTGPNSAVVLFDDSTSILIRHPEPNGPGSALGLKIRSPQFRALWKSGNKAATYLARSTTDGIVRTYSYRQVGDLPLFIMVGLAQEDYLAPWKEQILITAAFLVVLALLVTALSRSLLRAMRAQQQAYAHLALGQARLLDSEQRYRSVVDNVREVIFQTDAQGRWIFLNPAWPDVTGFSVEETLGARLLGYVHDEDRLVAQNAFHRLILREEDDCHLQVRCMRKDGGYRWVEAHVRLTLDAAGNMAGMSGTLADITENKLVQAKLQLAASVFTHAREAIMITSPNGDIIDVNDAFTQITGYSRSEAVGRNPRFLKSGLHGSDFYDDLWHKLNEQGFWYGELWNRRKSGEVFAVMETVSAVHDAQGQTLQYLSLFSDITTLKEHQRQLEYIAHYDALTGLPNRMLFSDRLHQAMEQALAHGRPLAVAYLDLDGFKAVNDTYGHEVGDQLLVAVANRIKLALRDGDTIARVGGDEFIAVLAGLNTIESSSTLLVRLLAAVAQPLHLGELMLKVSASIGVTFYPQNEAADSDQLLRQADQAMYQAKLAGKNRFHIFDADQDRSVRGHHESLEHIQNALKQREFELYYQPKVNMRTGALVGVEALVRWRHPEHGLLPPAVFLPVIEDHALSVELGDWVIDTALAQIERWHVEHGLDIAVSVNVSARQLQQADFVERLSALLAAHPGVKPASLELEVLETSALEDIAKVSWVMQACQEIGVSFALDDFGTGYSSLTYLKRLPALHLKIDQSFVCDMLDDTDDLAILEGILGLATAFRREVVAEGVETIAHGVMLLQLGCDVAQGYCIAHPMPAAQLPPWLAEWRPDPAWGCTAPVSRDDLPLLFASVEHRAWIAAVKAYLAGLRQTPPQLDHHQCRFGKWLHAEGLARYGTDIESAHIDLLHHQIHDLASRIMTLFADGEHAAVAQELAQLDVLRDSLLERLASLLDAQARSFQNESVLP